MRLAACLLGLALTDCAGEPSVSPLGETLTVGIWGGDGAGVIVSEAVTHVHVACTFGDVPGKIPLGSDGRFSMEGSYVLRAYPVQVGPSLPAIFTGRVRGRTLTLSIAVNDTVEQKLVTVGPVAVEYGREPALGPCPICRGRPFATLPDWRIFP